MANFAETDFEKQDRERRGVQPDEHAQQMIERFGDMELGQQLELLRAIVPDVLQRLSVMDRARFIQELEAPGELQ